jgi:hypothetical protein
MKKWSILVLIAVVALLMPMSATAANAQDEAGLSISKSADLTSAAVGETITYTYTISSSDNTTIQNISLVDDKLGTIDLDGQTSLDAGTTITAMATYTVLEADLPGPLVNTATISGADPDGNSVTASATASVDLTYTASIQLTKTAAPSPAAPHETITYTYTINNNGNVSINDLLLQDDELGAIPLTDATLAPSESLTATVTYTVTISDLPGPIVNTATATGTDPDGTLVAATTDPVSVSLYINKSLLTKAEILKLSGVRGKGILKAPGLQKLFNPKSQATEHAGKKDKDKKKEQLRIRQMTENHGAAKGQIKIEQKVKNQSK